MVTGAALFLLLVFSTVTAVARQSWPTQWFQIGVFAVVGAYLLAGIRRESEPIARGWTSRLVYLIPVWGGLQLLAHTTVAPFETQQAVLRWSALAGVFFLSQVVGGSVRDRRIFQNAFLCFAILMAILCLTQTLTPDGRLFGILPAEYSKRFGVFSTYDDYSQFVELALPIALWQAVRGGATFWISALAGGVLYASVIGSASRAGTVLCTAELVIVLAIGLMRVRGCETATARRRMTVLLVMVPVLAGGFTFAVGWQRVWHRFHAGDLYSVRREFLQSAVTMATQRPLTGFGLGSFPQVYPRFAVIDFPLFVNHAHNDWAEFAADGGLPFLLLVLTPFALASPAIFRNPWAIGIIALMLHACADFPFFRIDVAGWMFAMLGLVYMTGTARETSAPARGAGDSHGKQ